MSQTLGPQQKRLLIHFMAIYAIPKGSTMAINEGLQFFLDPERRKHVLQLARQDMEAAIEAIKHTHDNPHGSDSEAIATAIKVARSFAPPPSNEVKGLE